MSYRALALPLILLCAGCAPEGRREGPFDRALLDIAQTYETFCLVDANSRWAPLMCADIGFEEPSKAVEVGDYEFSASRDLSTHGRKLYVLLAKQLTREGSYISEKGSNAVGQVIVKEAWVPEEVPDDGKPLPRIDRHGKSVVPYARKEGKLYHAKEKGSLFIMFKMDPRTPNTDAGWVYGTVSADGKTVTSAGRVESCMKCHERAPHDRLFGLSADRP